MSHIQKNPPKSHSREAQARPVAKALLEWYDRNQRGLPWRKTRDPYAILVSEIMLQQTQVATVIPFYERFLIEFPDIESLAAASEEQVLRAWGGMGYYSRATNLWKAAQKIQGEYGGRVPNQVSDLLFLPGVGSYVAGAVASIAFGQKAAAIDTNAVRVICRLAAREKDPRSARVRREIEEAVVAMLPPERPGDFNQALMDLGATICRKSAPACPNCPLRDLCRAFQSGNPEAFPRSLSPKSPVVVAEATALLSCGSRWLLRRTPEKSGRYRGMWEFPTIEIAGNRKPARALQHFLASEFGLSATAGEEWAQIRHQVTHHKITKTVYRCALTPGIPPSLPASLRWVSLEQMDALPMGAPHQKIRAMLREENGFFGDPME